MDSNYPYLSYQWKDMVPTHILTFQTLWSWPWTIVLNVIQIKVTTKSYGPDTYFDWIICDFDIGVVTFDFRSWNIIVWGSIQIQVTNEKV